MLSLSFEYLSYVFFSWSFSLFLTRLLTVYMRMKLVKDKPIGFSFTDPLMILILGLFLRFLSEIDWSM